MTQSQLNRAVARKTGEDVRTIAGRGFTPLVPNSPAEDSDRFDDTPDQFDARLSGSRHRRRPVIS